MSENESILEIKDLILFYENAIAVNNVNMVIPRGKIVGVFGSNSAGKSSLMFCISGIILDVKKKKKNERR
jgi:branched-chain amino acid transport system ATP-binding protein